MVVSRKRLPDINFESPTSKTNVCYERLVDWYERESEKERERTKKKVPPLRVHPEVDVLKDKSSLEKMILFRFCREPFEILSTSSVRIWENVEQPHRDKL